MDVTTSLRTDDPPLLAASTANRLVEQVVAESGAHRRDVRSPRDGRLVGSVPLSTPQDVHRAFDRARVAQRGWAERPVRERSRVLMAFHDLVVQRREEALDIIQWENGKVRAEALDEVLDVANNARYYARSAASLLRPRRTGTPMPGVLGAVEVRHPVGVVGVITPWNYPLTLAASDSIPALLAGNAVVLKPDLQTPFSALWAADLLREAGLPSALYSVVLGDGPVIGPEVVDRADYVMFTGSTRVGREVAVRAADRLVGCSLELGGKNSFVVLDDADPVKAADGAVRSCFAAAGQLCVGTERVLVHERIWDDFVPEFLRRTDGLRLSTVDAWGADMGPLISAKQLASVQRHVDSAVDAGATVLAGGKPRPDVGPYFFEPTVLTDVPNDAAVWCEETFGPVVTLRRFSTEDEAVQLANDTAYGLNASVWSRDLPRARRLAERILVGTVGINEGYKAPWTVVDAPMGGMKASGLARRHGPDGLLKYTEPQTVAWMRGMNYGRPSWMSDEAMGKVLLGIATTLRRIPGRR
ncbi:MAG: succinic semialdehyde dehydrogenase [Candidatus Nanopelagicales bacterium]